MKKKISLSVRKKCVVNVVNIQELLPSWEMLSSRAIMEIADHELEKSRVSPERVTTRPRRSLSISSNDSIDDLIKSSTDSELGKSP